MSSPSSDSSDCPGLGRCRNAGDDGEAAAPGACRGRRGRRLLDPGMLRYVVLRHIAEQPRHGYDLIKLLEEQSGGMYAPSPGMIYPMLSLLENMGYVTSTANGNKKRYAITTPGRLFLEHNSALVDAIEGQIAALRSNSAKQLRLQMQALRDAVSARIRDPLLTPTQRQKIEDALNRALAEIQAL